MTTDYHEGPEALKKLEDGIAIEQHLHSRHGLSINAPQAVK